MKHSSLESKECKISLPSDFLFNSSLRKLSEDIFFSAGFSQREAQRLVLVFDEIFMNAVKHGSRKGSFLHLTFNWIPQKNVTVKIEDEGGEKKAFAVDLQKFMNREFQNNNPSKSHGRGLAQIAFNLTDNLKIEQSPYGGIAVTFEKSIL